jgi:hypothetical protein
MLKTALHIAKIASVATLVPCAAIAGTTQIVVQWLHAVDLMQVQTALDDDAAKAGYDPDGNDAGGGTENFYLYAGDATADGVVRSIIALQARHQLPDGMRIGVAVYKDASRKDWTYRPAYPAALKTFDITYKEKN